MFSSAYPTWFEDTTLKAPSPRVKRPTNACMYLECERAAVYDLDPAAGWPTKRAGGERIRPQCCAECLPKALDALGMTIVSNRKG